MSYSGEVLASSKRASANSKLSTLWKLYLWERVYYSLSVPATRGSKSSVLGMQDKYNNRNDDDSKTPELGCVRQWVERFFVIGGLQWLSSLSDKENIVFDSRSGCERRGGCAQWRGCRKPLILGGVYPCPASAPLPIPSTRGHGYGGSSNVGLGPPSPPPRCWEADIRINNNYSKFTLLYFTISIIYVTVSQWRRVRGDDWQGASLVQYWNLG